MKRGLSSFEFLATLSVVLMIAGAITTSTLEESRQTMLTSSAKSTIISKMEAKEYQNASCIRPKIKQYNVTQNKLKVNLKPDSCTVSSTEIANEVESEICGVNPDDNNIIKCGAQTLEVEIA